MRNEYLYNHKKGHGEFTPADVHSVACMEKRVPLFEAFLENVHKFVTDDSYMTEFTTVE